MTAKDIIAQNPAFGERRIRTAWDADKEEWFFSIVDVVAVLTDQPDTDHARNYWKVLKNRLKKEGNESVTNCNQLKMKADDGKMRMIYASLTDIITKGWERGRIILTEEMKNSLYKAQQSFEEGRCLNQDMFRERFAKWLE